MTKQCAICKDDFEPTNNRQKKCLKCKDIPLPPEDDVGDVLEIPDSMVESTIDEAFSDKSDKPAGDQFTETVVEAIKNAEKVVIYREGIRLTIERV